MADLGEGPGKKKKKNEKTQKEEKPAGQAIFANQISKKTAAPPLAQGLDPPLISGICITGKC